MFIASQTFDLDGAVMLDPLPSSDFGSLTRRSNRVATLDGGAAVNDFGFSDSDRVLAVNVKTARDTDTALRYIVRNYGIVHVSTDEGFFKAIPQYKPGPSISTVTLTITEKLSS